MKHHLQATTIVHQEPSDFLQTYHNVPHSTTNLAPAHPMPPRTHLAMTLPNIANQVKQYLVTESNLQLEMKLIFSSSCCLTYPSIGTIHRLLHK